MSSAFPTTRSFFSSLTSPNKENTQTVVFPQSPSSSSLVAGDGFSSSERLRDLPLSPGEWEPQHFYEEVSISDLCPGPRRVSFAARVVNIFDQTVESKIPRAAKGCLKVLVKDDGATILVRNPDIPRYQKPQLTWKPQIKLWYATTQYNLRLGTLITCWTTHISSTSSLSRLNEVLVPPASTILTSIFPERDSGCHIQVHTDDGEDGGLCRTPLGYVNGQSLAGLMSLDTYINGGGESIPEARLLVGVLAVGEATTVSTKAGATFATLDIGIGDQSARATLSLSLPLFSSTQSWTKFQTVILLSFPRLRANARLSITSCSYLDIDPDIAEAIFLRKVIQRSNCPINQPFPPDVFDIDAISSSPLRIQFTFADFSAFIAAAPNQVIGGYLSAILSQVNLVQLYTRKQLFSMECCTMPIYANCPSGECGQCGKAVALRINPNLIGELADETAAVGITVPFFSSSRAKTRRTHSRILWTDVAWTQLLGRSIDDLAMLCRDDLPTRVKKENVDLLRYLEQRLQWMRVILMVGWTGDFEGGRLAVLQVVE